MDASSYLRRIGCPGPHEPTLETLRKLHRAHMESVPFENLDIVLGRPIQLDPPALFDKIVTRRRGGFCYELNGLFAWLLGEIGFRVEMLSARVVIGGDPGEEFDHMLLLCPELGHIADVGFGDSFLEPLPLRSGEWTQGGASYRLTERNGDWELSQKTAGSHWAAQHRFTLQSRQRADYLPRCRHLETSPDSIFTQKSVCSRATPEGRVTLADGRLIVTINGDTAERPVAKLPEYRALLAKHFKINLNQQLRSVPKDRALRLLGPAAPEIKPR